MMRGADVPRQGPKSGLRGCAGPFGEGGAEEPEGGRLADAPPTGERKTGRAGKGRPNGAVQGQKSGGQYTAGRSGTVHAAATG